MEPHTIQTTLHRLDKLPGEARVWIYQANRNLSFREVEFLDRQAEAFVKQWAAHGNALTASWEVLYNRFLVLAVDENAAGASGCSIDSSVHFIEDVGKLLDVDFMDRSTILYLENNGHIAGIPFQKVEEAVKAGSITATTPVFDGTCTRLEQLQQGWPKNMEETWLARYI